MPKESQPVRIPLIGSYNQRLFSSSSASSSAVGIIVVGTGVVGTSVSTLNKDQRFVNFIPDVLKNPATGESSYYCHKRPGLATNTTPASGNIGTAIRIWTGNTNQIISAFGGTNSTIYEGTASIGTLTGLAVDITETVVGSTPTLVIPTDSNRAYYYPSGGAMTQITDADFPSNAGKTITGTFVHTNGYSFIMTTDGLIYNSDLNSISAWTSTSFIATNMYPDQGVGLARYKELIVAFGKESAEFFRHVGNAAGSPLEKIQEATIRIGCIQSTALCSLEDNIAWVASSDTGSESVYILDGYKPVRISNNAIDTYIANRGETPIYLTSCKLNGKTLIFVIFNTITFVYCVEDQMWHEWAGNSILWHKMTASSAAASSIYAVSRSSTSGKVYLINFTAPVYADDGNNYEALIQTSPVDLGTERRKMVSRMTVIGDTPPATTTLSVSWSDDDYTTWSTARDITMGSRKYLSNIGQFRRRSFRLSNTSGQPLRLEAMEFEIRLGLH